MKSNEILQVCQKCKAKCCRMGGADFTKSEMQKVLKAGCPDFFVKIKENWYELRNKRLICPYLSEDNSCSIPEFRPLPCRFWPIDVEYENNNRKYFLVECPLTFLLSRQDIQIMKKLASRIPKEIVDDYCFSKSKLPKSEIKQINKRFKKFKRTILK